MKQLEEFDLVNFSGVSRFYTFRRNIFFSGIILTVDAW